MILTFHALPILTYFFNNKFSDYLDEFALCVRDWSGILCERSDSGASKDIAESPTAEL